MTQIPADAACRETIELARHGPAAEGLSVR